MENARLVTALREADRRKDEFLAMLAHELRNPLAPIRNAAQVLRAKGPPAGEVQWATEVIDRQVHQLARLVDDLLDVSRITRGKIELRKERVELGAVVRGAVEATRPLVEKWGHALGVSLPSEPVYLDADPTRLAQVVSNMLNNAAKYTDHGGHIAVAVERRGAEVLIRVRDDGIGIPKDALSRIFEMFTQLPGSVERSQGGLGIGLTLVRRLVELHGGAVEALSEGAGRGSEFVVRLPLAPAPEDPRQRPGDAGPPAPGRRILVVDDNRDAAESLGMLLGMVGHEVRVAHDGLEACAAAEEFRPDVVLLDLGLPKLSGYEVARRLREAEGGSDVLLVALTGWGQEEDRRRTREAGFDHHLTKPVELEQLRRLLAGAEAHGEGADPSHAP
jgi:CheY-like chemotaxis protein